MDAQSQAIVDRFVQESPIERRPVADWIARAAAETRPGARVLDAGAGDAPYAGYFEHCRYTTSDWAQSVHPGAAHVDVVAPLTALPLEDDTFDLVVCTQVLEHVARPEAALREFCRVLAPGGNLWLTVPFVGELHEEPYDFFRYTRYGLAELCEQAGFVDVVIEPFGGYFSTLGQMARNCALATGVQPGERTAARAVATCLRLLGGWLPRLDRLDRRHALPLGYGVRASSPSVRS